MKFDTLPKLLSIRSRVIAIVSSIFLILFTLTAYSFNQKWYEHSFAEQSRDAFEITVHANHLVYELQKERGISAGFSGSKLSKAGKVAIFKADMLEQRQNSDVHVTKMFELISLFQKKWGASSSRFHLNEMQAALQDLKALRLRVEFTDETAHLFDAYSDLISLLLNQVRKTSSTMISTELINEFNSYMQLIWLLERAGQERGTVNGILGEGSIDVSILLKANGYISNQNMLLLDFNSSAKPEYRTLLDESLGSEVARHVLQLRQSVIQQVELNDLLNTVHSYIGFEGLIHNFKNYVIRGDAEYNNKFHVAHDEFKLLLHEIKQLHGLEQEALNQLSIIEDTMDQYHNYVEQVRSLKASGKSIADIDHVVKVNDLPANQALDYLRSVITQIDQVDWWRSATARMDQIALVGKAIENNLIKKFQQSVESSYQAIVYYLIIGLIVIILTSFFAYYLIRHVAGSLTSMAKQLTTAAEQGNHYHLFTEPRKDEIGMLAEAFNNLIKERQLSERLLRKLSSSVEQTSESMVIINRDKIIEYANPATERLTGFKKTEIIGENIDLFKYESNIVREITRTVLKGESWRGRAQVHLKDGSAKSIMLAISPINDEKDELTHLIIAQQDISELERLEEQFHQAQKMESIGNLVGGIAHDFNNILAGMTGKLYLAQSKVEKAPIDAIKNISDAEELGYKAASMIQQLLTFARRDTVKVGEIDLVLVIKEAFNLSKTAIPENIKIDLKTCEEALPVQGDVVQTHQILMNLINNAIHAVEGKKGGHVSVSVAPFQADEQFMHHNPELECRELARLRVEDNGMGISEQNIQHVFEPFYTTKGVGKGTGLGLSMVYGAVKRHGGTVNITSHHGSGCRIDIYFPMIDAKNFLESRVEERKLHHGNGELILVVDDNIDVLETNCSILEDLGYVVIKAVDGRHAVECFSQQVEDISLVMLDVVMPVMGGVEAAEEIWMISSHMPIIFMTGYDKDQELLKKVNLKESVVMSKPAPIEEIALQLHLLIKNR